MLPAPIVRSAAFNHNNRRGIDNTKHDVLIINPFACIVINFVFTSDNLKSTQGLPTNNAIVCIVRILRTRNEK